MSKPKDFDAPYVLAISRTKYLHLLLKQQDGRIFAYSAYFNELGERVSNIVRTMVKESKKEYLYFVRDGQRFYLKEFVSKTQLNR